MFVESLEILLWFSVQMFTCRGLWMCKVRSINMHHMNVFCSKDILPVGSWGWAINAICASDNNIPLIAAKGGRTT